MSCSAPLRWKRPAPAARPAHFWWKRADNRRVRGLRLSLALAVAMVAAGCYGNDTPGPTPGSMDDVIAAIVLQDVTVLHLTSGDPGCPTLSLHDNAVHLTVAIGSQSSSHEIYLLRWKNQATFDAAASDFAMCVSEFEASNPTMRVDRVASFPWRAYGPGWTPQLTTIIRNALSAAGGG